MFARACIALAAGLLLVAAPRPAAADLPIVAVFNIEAKRINLPAAVLSGLSDYLTTQIAASGAFSVVPRDRLKSELTKQKKASYKTCYSQSCQIEIGQELAAQKSLASQILKLGGKCVVSANLFDLKRAATDRAATVEGGCSEAALMASLRAVVQKLSGGAVTPPAPAVKVEQDPQPASSGTARGPAAAPVTLEEFTDYECRFCRRSHQDIVAAMAKYPGKVRWVHHDYPLDASCNPMLRQTVHPMACRAAYYARCAGDQGKFAAMDDAIFAGEQVSEAGLQAAARRVGLDLGQLERCLRSPRTRQAILSDIKLAVGRKVGGTPVVFVNGEQVIGAREPGYWEKKIGALLGR